MQIMTRVKMTEKHTVHADTLEPGDEIAVSREIADRLVKKGVAVLVEDAPKVAVHVTKPEPDETDAETEAEAE